MRLLPFLASLASLGLFWRLAWSTVPPLAALFAVGLLAVARWPITMGSFVKPYSCRPADGAGARSCRPGMAAPAAAAALAGRAGTGDASRAAGIVSGRVHRRWRQSGPVADSVGSGWAGRSLFIAYNALVAARS